MAALSKETPSYTPAYVQWGVLDLYLEPYIDSNDSSSDELRQIMDEEFGRSIHEGNRDSLLTTEDIQRLSLLTLSENRFIAMEAAKAFCEKTDSVPWPQSLQASMAIIKYSTNSKIVLEAERRKIMAIDDATEAKNALLNQTDMLNYQVALESVDEQRRYIKSINDIKGDIKERGFVERGDLRNLVCLAIHQDKDVASKAMKMIYELTEDLPEEVDDTEVLTIWQSLEDYFENLETNRLRTRHPAVKASLHNLYNRTMERLAPENNEFKKFIEDELEARAEE